MQHYLNEFSNRLSCNCSGVCEEADRQSEDRRGQELWGDAARLHPLPLVPRGARCLKREGPPQAEGHQERAR